MARFLEPASLLAAGIVAGWVTWNGPYGSFIAALLVPLLWAQSRSAVSAALVYAGWFFGSCHDEVGSLLSFFPAMSPAAATGIVIGHAALLSLPFWAAWKLRVRWGGPLSFVAALVAVSVPPLGAVGQLPPLMVAGDWFPGAGWLGIAAMLALLGAMASNSLPAKGWALLAALTLHGFLVFAEQDARPPKEWTAVTTHLPGYKNVEPIEDYAARHTELLDLAWTWLREAEAGDVLVFPENAAGRWGSVADALWAGVAQEAARRGSLVLIGASLPGREGNSWRNAAVLLGAHTGAIEARQPVPVSSWRPWDPSGAETRWFAFGASRVANLPIAVSFCYETLLAWPVPWQFLGQAQPRLLVELANHHWEAPSSTESRIQRRALVTWGRLFSVPVLLADNRPPTELWKNNEGESK